MRLTPFPILSNYPPLPPNLLTKSHSSKAHLFPSIYHILPCHFTHLECAAHLVCILGSRLRCYYCPVLLDGYSYCPSASLLLLLRPDDDGGGDCDCATWTEHIHWPAGVYYNGGCCLSAGGDVLSLPTLSLHCRLHWTLLLCHRLLLIVGCQ